MSVETSSPSKKRKHEESPTAGSSKDGLAKKTRKFRKEKTSRKSKSKTESEFKVVNASVRVSIAPIFSAAPLDGAIEMLDSLVMRYVPSLKGVMLAHSNVKFVSQSAVIQNEYPFLNCVVNFDATIWSPQLEMTLVGKIKLHSPDHIALLVHNTFNVSIPREHIPSGQWVFQHGPAENDPEFGSGANADEEEKNGQSSGWAVESEWGKSREWGKTEEWEKTEEWGTAGEWGTTSEKKCDEVIEDVEDVSLGVWVNNSTGERLGGSSRMVKLTVIGMTVANHMLSLRGSLQPDPFSSEHAPKSVIPSAEDSKREEVEVESMTAPIPELDDDDSDLEDDPLASAASKWREAEEEKKKEDKTKRKEEKKRRRAEREAKETGGTDKLDSVESPDVRVKKKRKKDKGES